ncbi:MAG: hypothetical protein ACI9E5_000878 [Candidatus Omnitrophota bacterium]|jgi:hypothetical protein
MKLLNQLFLSLAILLSSSTITFAESTERVNDIKRLLNRYVRVVKTHDTQQIDGVWYEINNNVDAVKYMKDNLPKYYYSYKMYELSIRARDTAFNVDEAEEAPLDGNFEPKVKTSSSELSNSDRVKRFSNQDQPDNRRIAQLSLNQNSSPNQNIVQSDKNQNRLSNQEQIRIRTKNRLE